MLLAPLAIVTALAVSPTDVWSASSSNVPSISGRITLHDGAGWSARIGTSEASPIERGRDVRFVFPRGRGELRLSLPLVAGSTGMWVQPGARIDDNAYATSVPLHREGTAWVGSIVPFVPRSQLYVKFSRRTDGSLTGFIRDPIGNFGTMAPFDTVAISGRSIEIHARTHVYRGAFDAGPDAMHLSIGTGPPILFRRVAASAATGFYPRALSTHAVRVATPMRASDGWPVGSLEGLNVARAPVELLARYLATLSPSTPRSPYIQSVVAARDGTLFLDEYYFGFDRLRPHDVRSAGKSLTPALFGAAINLEPSLSVESPVVRSFPYKSYAHPDPRKDALRVADLLEMSSGFACDDNNDDSPGNEDTMQSQTAQPDWYKYVMDLPLVSDPGSEHAVYCSGGLNVVGGVIAGATHRWTPELFESAIARPLEFGEYHLQLTPGGEMYLGGGSYFLPRDFLKLGQVFLNGGTWHEARVLPASWTRAVVSPHSGLTHPGDYGYGWHLTRYRVGKRTYGAYEAQGNGGQYIVVVPAFKLVVGIMAANYGDYSTWRRYHDLVERYVVAACR